MSGNRSLDEFAGAGAGDDPGDGGAEADGTESDVPADEASADRNGAPAAVEEATEVPDAADAADAPTDGAVAPAADDDAGTDDEAPEPPASTYAWSPEGGECAGCGSTVEERWRDGDDLVCVECKDW